MAMRDEIYKAIMKGGATKESLLTLTGTTEKGLASQFTYLRMTGKCPQKQEDGTFKIISADEWEATRGTAGTKSDAALSPADKEKKAAKRAERAQSAYDNASKKLEASPEDVLTKLKFTKAEAELKIAEIELGMAETLAAEAPDAEVPGDGPFNEGIEGLDEGEDFEDLDDDDLN